MTNPPVVGGCIWERIYDVKSNPWNYAGPDQPQKAVVTLVPAVGMIRYRCGCALVLQLSVQ